MTDCKTLISYVAYYVSRGQAVISPLSDRLSFQGLVYEYRGYHPDFLLFWQQLQQQRDFCQLCLEGDTFTFKQLLEHRYEISECARCYLPIPTSTGGALDVPACHFCDREPSLKSSEHQAVVSQSQSFCPLQLTQPQAPHASLVQQLEHNFNLLRGIVIGSPPLPISALNQLLSHNGFKLSFVETPEAAIQLAQEQPVDLILIDAEISEPQGRLWSQQLHQVLSLQYTPVVGFSAEAGEGVSWSDQRLSIIDYLLMPLSGQHLAEQLRQLSQQSALADIDIYWFPRLPNSTPPAIETPPLPAKTAPDLEYLLNERTVALEIAYQQQNTLQQQVEELESSHRRKDDFLNTVSHELRTPITNVKMAIHMLTLALNKAGVLEPNPNITTAEQQKIAHYLQILQLECDREISLINELLDLQRLESEQAWVAESVQLQTWLPHLVEPFQTRTQQRQQTLQITIEATLPSLSTDLSSLERILAELLNNACKYTPAQAQITLSVCNVADRIQLTVSNSGIEIPLEQLPHIFERFYRISSHDPWKEGGTGLGLTLVQKLVERLGGKITVESGAQQTQFRVELPLQRPQPKPQT